MITSQDIRAKSFEKAVFGGYDMAGVDSFLENVARTVEDQAKEIATLKSKMKILANKVEEYRSTEEAMRLALVSAQQLATQIEAEARAKADSIVDEATARSLETLSDLKKQTASEETRLVAAQAAYTKYVTDARDLCLRQIAYLDNLPEEMYGETMPKSNIEPEITNESDEMMIDEIIKETEEIEEIPELIIEQPAAPSDDFEATLRFSLD